MSIASKLYEEIGHNIPELTEACCENVEGQIVRDGNTDTFNFNDGSFLVMENEPDGTGVDVRVYDQGGPIS